MRQPSKSTLIPRRALQAVVLTALVVSALVAVSCNSHPVDPLENNIAAEREDIITSAGASKVDVLWVIDSSGSMCQEQDNLRQNFQLFIQELAKVQADFRLAVISTDMRDPTKQGRFQNIPDNRPGASEECRSALVDISECPSETEGQPAPLIISSRDPQYQNAEGDLDVAKVQRDFNCNATVGVRGDSFEMGLEAAKTALSPALTGTVNSDFLRDDAFLAIVFLTDENDCSTDGSVDLTTGDICEWERDKLNSTQAYVDFFANLKKDVDGNPDPDRVIMAGIFAPDKIGSDGQPIRYAYGDPVESSCSSEFGEGYAGYRYAEVINAFPNKSTANICEPSSFPSAVQALGILLSDLIGNRCLQAPPFECETNADCAGSCEERGSIKVCEAFRIQAEVTRPTNGDPEGNVISGFTVTTKDAQEGECQILSGENEGKMRCILREGEDFSIDYDAKELCTYGVNLDLNITLGSDDAFGVRYPRSITAEVETEATPNEGEEGGEASGE